MNPAPDSLADHEKIEILEEWLTEVERQDDPVRIIHGNMYLANSYYRMSDFETSMRYLIAAEGLAEETENILLLGRIWHKIGAIQIFLENHDEAITSYRTASDFHLAARDSQYMGITYEQLGTDGGTIAKELINSWLGKVCWVVCQKGL
ncbi:hypothetical protein CEQ90_04350 [Lewinellaceae bacterium SD302]|nr:hypothetical protein CEQ90_04350 [Lewinellaceae bacterium SD302]